MHGNNILISPNILCNTYQWYIFFFIVRKFIVTIILKKSSVEITVNKVRTVRRIHLRYALYSWILTSDN